MDFCIFLQKSSSRPSERPPHCHCANTKNPRPGGEACEHSGFGSSYYISFGKLPRQLCLTSLVNFSNFVFRCILIQCIEAMTSRLQRFENDIRRDSANTGTESDTVQSHNRIRSPRTYFQSLTVWCKLPRRNKFCKLRTKNLPESARKRRNRTGRSWCQDRGGGILSRRHFPFFKTRYACLLRRFQRNRTRVYRSAADDRGWSPKWNNYWSQWLSDSYYTGRPA